MVRSDKEKSLATRLFAVLFASAFLAFAAASAIAAYVSWTVYEGDAEQRLTAQLEVARDQMAGLSPQEMAAELAGIHLAETRITLVAGDGAVMYDSAVSLSDMGNHADREEIRSAQESGKSVVLRRSETTGTDSLYAASVVDSDGTVLRLSESRTSLPYYVGSLVAPLSVAIAAAILVSALLARLITRKITSPMLKVNLEEPLSSEAYREMMPLLERIDAQRMELTSQNLQLAQAVDARREFTGNVSHEMKSPLQIIGGYAELIESGVPTPEETRRFAGLIRSEAGSMRELIDDVLTLSRLDERVLGEPNAVDMCEVVRRVVTRLSANADTRNVEITCTLQEGVFSAGDESLVEHAVYNLVDNAIRYGDQYVRVDVFSEGERAFLVVSDDGEGIPESQRERVFERFYRVDSSRSRNTGGTGLGLAIVKHAAESMGGSVHAGQSDMGGAKLTLSLSLSA